MKNTKICPKCNSSDIVRIDGYSGPYGTGNNIMTKNTIFSAVNVNRYICCECGYTEEWIDREDIEKVKELRILSSSEETGVYAVTTKNGRQIFVTGHSEYDAETLGNEYRRDLAANLPIQPPAHYFPDDDPTRAPVVNWRSCANLFYSNWLNYYVYQTTPYDVKDIQ